MTNVDYTIVKRPFENSSDCGDWGMVYEHGDEVFIAIIDALGHGAWAQEMVDQSEPFIRENYRKSPAQLTKALHTHTKGSRGCVGAFCQFNALTGALRYTMTGNIKFLRIGVDHEEGIAQPGTIGYRIRTPQEKHMTVSSGDILILHTDGISGLGKDDLPAFVGRDANEIGAYIVEHYVKSHDDALCIVLKYEK